MSDELKRLEEELQKTLSEAKGLTDKVTKLEAAGAAATLAKETADRAVEDAKKLADRIDETERKFLAEASKPRVTLSPEDSKTQTLRDESALVGQYWKTGQMTEEFRKLAMATDNTTGHYVIMPPTMAADILGLLRTYSAMEQVCDVQTIDGTEWEQVVVTGAAAAFRVTERGTRSASDTPTFGKDRIPAGGYGVYPSMTQEQLYKTRDFDLGAFVMDEGNFAIQALAEDDYVNGAGVGDYPKGLLANTTLQAAATVSGNASDVDDWTKLVAVTGGVHESMLPNARWMMKRSTAISLMQLTDGMDRPIWQPGLANGQPDMLCGFPVVYNGYFPAISDYATKPYVAAFGDFKQGYKIIVSRFALLIRDEVTSPGYVKLYKEIKKGGNVRRAGDAIALLKVAAA